MIKIGNADIVNIYIGDSAATAVYVGNDLVWSTGGKDYSKEYFTLKALESGEFGWPVDNVEYSLNDGIWTAWDSGSTLSVNSGDAVRFKSSTNTTYGSKTITSTGNFDVEGNSMSLFYGDNFENQTVLSVTNTFNHLFYGCTKVINAENLVLPATTLMSRCYVGMFQGCTSLTKAPELPAKNLQNYCYNTMFAGCTSLTKAPELQATTLMANCYDSMFSGCTALTTAPTVLSGEIGMFASYISYRMFYGCTSLTTAPEIRIQKPYNHMFREMFAGCSSLNYVKCLATDISANNCTTNWLNGVSSTGTFVKDANMTAWPTGASGIPDGWTIIDA